MTKRENRFGRLRTSIIIGVLLAAFGAGAVAFLRYYDYSVVAGEYPDAERAYRKAGIPWSAQDLQPAQPVEPEENAASLLREAIAAVPQKHFSLSNADWKAIRVMQNSENYPSLLDPTEKHHAALKKAIQASNLPKLDFHRDWGKGLAVLLTEESRTRWFVRQLCLRAEAETGLGDYDAAALDLRAAWKLSELIGSEPAGVSYLCGRSAEALTLVGIERCASIANGSLEALTMFGSIISVDSAPNLARAIHGDMFTALVSLRTLKAGVLKGFDLVDYSTDESVGNRLDKVVDHSLPDESKLRAYLTRYLQICVELDQVMTRFQSDPAAMGLEMDRVLELTSTEHGKSSKIANFFGGFRGFGDSAVKREAHLLATRALLQALIIRAQTGSFPKSIRDIPGAWIDPYDHKSLLMIVSGKSLRIYSVGPDRKDERGLTRMETEGTGKLSDDVAAIFPPVKLRS